MKIILKSFALAAGMVKCAGTAVKTGAHGAGEVVKENNKSESENNDDRSLENSNYQENQDYPSIEEWNNALEDSNFRNQLNQITVEEAEEYGLFCYIQHVNS